MKVLMEKMSPGRKFSGAVGLELIETSLSKADRDELLKTGSVVAEVGGVKYKFTTDGGDATNVWKLLKESLAKAGVRK